LPLVQIALAAILLCLSPAVTVEYNLNAIYEPANPSGGAHCVHRHQPRPAATPKDSTAKKYVLQYDPSVSRIPGKSLPIGIVTLSAGAQPTQTKGFLKGRDGWSKYRLEVQGGSYSNGKIKIAKSSNYLKGDSLTVSVYTRKWFLGGKDKFLLTQKIPYNYEDSINILTTGNIGKAPGDHVQFGIRTWYDNKQFADKWAPAKKNLKGFLFNFDGSHLSKSKSDLKIDGDPEKITNDQVRLIAMLAKDSVIKDTLQIMLDYVAGYQCKIVSSGDGHKLNVTADAYFDSLINATLLKVTVVDSGAKKTYHYRVNTKGGSIMIASKGADGSDGRSGFDGTPGSPGSPGSVSVDVETVTNPDGTTSTTTNTVEGPGGDGGAILIRYPPAVTPFLSLIKAKSIAGAGGSGGRGGQGGSGGSAGSKGKVTFVQSPASK
jgi:hypothetical protein